MCQAIYFHSQQIEQRIHFSNSKALLPVQAKDGSIRWVPWGRHTKQPGNLPLGGWARLERVQQGHWNSYFPQPVKIVAHAFMEKDFEGNSAWYPLVKGQCLQGVAAHYDRELRVYIVTITPTREDAVHLQWPRIIRL